jgi:hypothetical protein
VQPIYRDVHDQDNPYLTVSKRTIRDHELSFEARGFLVDLLANSDNWQFRPDVIARDCRRSRATVYRLLKVLIAAGYVERKDMVRHRPDGRFQSGTIYCVFESRRAASPDLGSVPF